MGLARVERAVAAWWRANVPGVRFAYFDRQQGAYVRIDERWIDMLLSGDAIVQPKWDKRRNRYQRIRRDLRGIIRQPRQRALAGLERVRLGSRSAWLARLVERLQNSLIKRKSPDIFIKEDGGRRAVLTEKMAVDGPIAFDAETVLVSFGLNWLTMDLDALAELKRRSGMGVVLFCADLIPVQFPQFYPPQADERYREHFSKAFPLADVVLFSAHRIEQDAIDFAHEHGVAIGKTAVLPLGADSIAGKADPGELLPEGLQPGRYVLFVSTLEPRKGHAMLYRVWLRLLAEGVPQETGFKLVFAGREGWQVEELMAALRSDKRPAGTLRVLGGVPDTRLRPLYEEAAFCVYPSLYEGFGLPLVESLLHGKALIASTGGAIPEVVGRFAPCLDPLDEEAWYATLKEWITDPATRAPYEAAIRDNWRAPTWGDFAGGVLAIAKALPDRAEKT
jgi:glycosyltransferase involved in cell wall biosynthesis